MKAIAPYPDAQSWVMPWLAVAKKATWTCLEDVRRVYGPTDQVGKCLIFDVKGNTYRLIVTVKWARISAGKRIDGVLYIKHFLTHAEYNKHAWKGCC